MWSATSNLNETKIRRSYDVACRVRNDSIWSNSQLNKLKSGIKNGTELKLKLSTNVFGDYMVVLLKSQIMSKQEIAKELHKSVIRK